MKSYNIQTNRKYSNRKPQRIKNEISERITPKSFTTHPCRECPKNPKKYKKCNRYHKLSQKIKTRDLDKEKFSLSITQKIEGIYQDAIEECLIDQSKLLTDLINDSIDPTEKKCKSILELIESLNNSMQDTIDYVKRDQKICETKLMKLLTKVNVQKFIINVHDMHNVYDTMHYHDEQTEKRMAHRKAPIDSCVEHRHFTIRIKKRHLFYNWSVCDIDTCSVCLFQKLAYFYIQIRLILNAKQKRQFQPSNMMRVWYIRDFIQGFRLSLILIFNNASTLHYMRNLFFVIITSLKLRLTVEINFEFPKGNKCGMLPPPTPFENIPFKIIHWNNGHSNTLINSCSRIFHTAQPPCIGSGCDATRTTVSDTILHSNTNLAESTANTFEECSEAVVNCSKLKSESGLLDIRNTINYTNFALHSSRILPLFVRSTDTCASFSLNGCQKNTPLSVRNNLALKASERIIPISVRNTDIYNNFDLIESQITTPLSVRNAVSYTNLALNASQIIMPISIGNIRCLNREQYTVCKNSAMGLHPRKQIYRIRYSTLQQRTWMSKVYKVSAQWKNEVLKLYLDSFINESMFDKVGLPLDKYLYELTTYCAQCLVNAFKYVCSLKFDLKLIYKTFMSYFGYYLLP